MSRTTSISPISAASAGLGNCCGEMLRPFWNVVETGLLESGSLGGGVQAAASTAATATILQRYRAMLSVANDI